MGRKGGLRHYVWNSGVKVYTDLATGEVIRRTLIMSEGPANGKLRKREIFKDGRWILDRQNSYDPKGRPIRAIHGDSIRIWKWRNDGSVTITENGQFVEDFYKFENGKNIRRRFVNGVLLTTTTDLYGNLVSVEAGSTKIKLEN